MFAEIRKIIAEQLGLDESTITLSSDLKNDLGADSIDMLQFIVAAEDRYGILVEDEEAMQLHTVGDVVAFIESKKE